MTLTPDPGRHPATGGPSRRSALATRPVRERGRPVLRHVPVTPPVPRAGVPLVGPAAAGVPLELSVATTAA
ncbi:MAG TPA: hypothetical protein VK083_23225 [Nocardia sp.]|uniref:hypothetical protein n=1 Tax=Nocardia TaxID=1817 RepID=UPI002456247E|nr:MULTISPECIES: hypothetical protein [Nocardia]HLS79706.1 hypothetical protein [Nocardia sp.]